MDLLFDAALVVEACHAHGYSLDSCLEAVRLMLERPRRVLTDVEFAEAMFGSMNMAASNLGSTPEDVHQEFYYRFGNWHSILTMGEDDSRNRLLHIGAWAGDTRLVTLVLRHCEADNLSAPNVKGETPWQSAFKQNILTRDPAKSRAYKEIMNSLDKAKPAAAIPEDHAEYQYLKLVKQIMDHGSEMVDRTGVGTLSIFGAQTRWSLRNGVFPLLTTKRVPWAAVVGELLWFVRGSTDARQLASEGINIWNGNSSRSFLDAVGLPQREEGDLGPIYGFQWRHCGAEYVDMHTDYTGKGIDQLQNVIDTIKTNPADRRMIMCSWNPCDLQKMALPPCHCLVQFYVANGELSTLMYQRSADMGLGVPFNIASYALLTYMIAHVTGLRPGEFIHSMGNAHVYLNHVNPLKRQLTRIPKPFPFLAIRRPVSKIDDFTADDFILSGYVSHGSVPMQMAI